MRYLKKDIFYSKHQKFDFLLHSPDTFNFNGYTFIVRYVYYGVTQRYCFSVELHMAYYIHIIHTYLIPTYTHVYVCL